MEVNWAPQLAQGKEAFCGVALSVSCMRTSGGRKRLEKGKLSTLGGEGGAKEGWQQPG